MTVRPYPGPCRICGTVIDVSETQYQEGDRLTKLRVCSCPTGCFSSTKTFTYSGEIVVS